MLFMGIDIGTQGVRVIAADENGSIAAGSSIWFETLNVSEVDNQREQSSEVWWNSVKRAIAATTRELKDKGFRTSEIQAIGVDGTSGTILAIDKNHTALTNGIMYNDMRSKKQAEEVRRVSSDHERKAGFRYNASFALPKALWIMEQEPHIYEQAERIIHQTDFIVGKLCGEYGVSDYSNALKSGYDLIDNCWPEYIGKLGIERSKLPEILAPGEKIGNVSQEAADEMGLSVKTAVTAGATDGYASALAAGAVHIGDWATIIGTTLVLKGVTSDIRIDPTGSSYSHKLPSGSWMTGGASNAGGCYLNSRFGTEEFKFYDRSAEMLSPTGVLIYPLTGVGERYPFLDPEARAFICGDTSDKSVLYTAIMEGVGYVEKLAYEKYLDMGCKVGDEIFTTGGACKSEEWLRIRASILERSLKVPVAAEAAIGTAMLAASKTYFGSLEDAADRMISFVKTVEPVKEKVKRYQELYGLFYEQCEKSFALR
jgi:sugar (pentulose or hexulose) kinase